MKSPTKTAYWGARSRLRQVDQDPGHYRRGRWVLLAEGLLVAALGLAGLVSNAVHPGVGGGWGAPVLMLRLTVAHSVLLLVFGVLAVAVTPSRHWTARVTGLGVVGFLLLFTIGTVTAARGVPAGWGLDARDAVMHGVLLVVNLTLFIWLLPDELQDPAWVWKRGSDTGGGNPETKSETSPPPSREDSR